MEKLLIIQTGGTIDKDYPRTQLGYAFEITSPAVQRVLSKINPSFEFEIISLLKKDSSEITDSDRELIKNKCLQSDCPKILITHGTDTMIETGLFLKEIQDKTVVITGAFLPERFKDSDADFNIGFAIGALLSLDIGVFIAMNGNVVSATNCYRNKESGKFQSNIH